MEQFLTCKFTYLLLLLLLFYASLGGWKRTGDPLFDSFRNRLLWKGKRCRDIRDAKAMSNKKDVLTSKAQVPLQKLSTTSAKFLPIDYPFLRLCFVIKRRSVLI